MKIGVLTHNYPRFRGDFSGRFVAALSEELARQGHAVTVLAPWDEAYGVGAGGFFAGGLPQRGLSPTLAQNDGETGGTPQGALSRSPAQDAFGPVLRLYRYAPFANWHRLGYMRTMQADVRLRKVTYLLAPGLFLAGSLAVERWVRQARPDVLHAHWALPNGFMAALAARRHGVPLVVSIPGSDATVAAGNPVFGRMARFAFATAGLVTANSAALRDVAIHDLGADPARFDLIAYGVDPDAYRPDATGTDALRRELNIPPDAFVVLAVGRMVHKKGFDRLLAAAAHLGAAAAQPGAAVAQPGAGVSRSIHYVLVGEGDLWAEWQALGRGLGLGERVHWTGNVPSDRLGVYYNMADVLAMPSVTHPADGLNVTVLDAMSCAKPVIGTAAAGNELAIRDGVNGFLLPEGDDAAFAAALAALAANRDLGAAMGQAGRTRIENELGWPHLARRYVAHFERLAHFGRLAKNRSL